MTDAKAGTGSSAPRSSDPLPKDLQGEDLSGSPAPRLDPKGSIVPEYFDWRPRMSLGAVASLRKDELTGKAAWDEAQGWSLNPGRYVGVAPGEEVSDEDFKEQFETLNEELTALNSQARKLEATIAQNVAEILEGE
jgi:hypothetical protein